MLCSFSLPSRLSRGNLRAPLPGQPSLQAALPHAGTGTSHTGPSPPPGSFISNTDESLLSGAAFVRTHLAQAQWGNPVPVFSHMSDLIAISGSKGRVILPTRCSRSVVGPTYPPLSAPPPHEQPQCSSVRKSLRFGGDTSQHFHSLSQRLHLQLELFSAPAQAGRHLM